jgi:hypothetical protein
MAINKYAIIMQIYHSMELRLYANVMYILILYIYIDSNLHSTII